MKYTPKSANRKHEAASLILLITAVVMFYFGAQYYTAYRGAVQFAAVLCMAGAAFFIMKKLTVYTYAVYPKDRDTKKSVSELGPDELTFMISKRYGRGAESNKAALDLGALTDAAVLPFNYSEKQKIIKSHGKMALYYYTVTFKPPRSVLLVFEQDGEKIGAVVEPDSDFEGFFTEVARLNKEKMKEEDE